MNLRQRSGPGGSVRDHEVYAELIAERGPEVERAIDVFHVAVLFEANGMSDRMAAEVYGAADVVELARQVAEVVPYRPEPPPSGPPGWHRATGHGYGRCLVRGLGFVAAGLMAMVAAVALDVPFGDEILLVSSMVATALVGPLSFLAHLITERAGADRREAAVSPLFHVGGGMVAVTGGGAAVAGGLDVAALTAGPLAYALLAVLLVVLRRERTVGALLVPGAAAAGLHLVPAEPLIPAGTAAATAGLGLGAMAVVTAVTLRHRGRLGNEIGWPELMMARPFLWTGAGVAALVGTTIWYLSRLEALQRAGSRGWLLAALPLLVVLALTELAVVALRRRVGSMAARSSGWWAVERSVDRATGALWATLVGSTAAMVAVVAWVEPVPSFGLSLLVGATFGALGLALVARALEPDPFDQRGAMVLLAAAGALAGLTLVSDGSTGAGSASGPAALALIVLGGGWVTAARRSWQRSRHLSAHRWTL